MRVLCVAMLWGRIVTAAARHHRAAGYGLATLGEDELDFLENLCLQKKARRRSSENAL